MKNTNKKRSKEVRLKGKDGREKKRKRNERKKERKKERYGEV